MSTSVESTRRAWAKQASGLLVANVFRNAGYVAILILLAQLTNPDTLGKYALALAITMPVFVLAQMSLKTLYLTNHRSHPFRGYHALAALALVMAVPVSLGLAALINPGAALTVLLVALTKVNDAMCELYSGPMQEYRKTGLIVRGYAIEAVVGTAAVTVVLILTRDMNLALTALVVVTFALTAVLMLLPGLAIVRHHEKTSAPSPRLTSEMWHIARLGIPTGASFAVFTLVLTVPQYFLSFWKGDAAVAHFATALYALAVVDLLLNTLTQAWIPQARDAFWVRVKAGTSFAPVVTRTIGIWTGIFVPLTVAGLLLLVVAMPFVFGADYALTVPVALALGVCVLVSPSQHFAGVGLTVANLYKRSLIPSAVAAAVTTLASLIVIPRWDNAGAFAAIAAGLVTKAVIALWLLRGRAVAPRKVTP